jgi:hypothetical protein
MKQTAGRGPEQGVTALDWLFLALGQHRLGNRDAARESLKNATGELERAHRTTWLATWKDQVAYQRLRREVEEQLKK